MTFKISYVTTNVGKVKEVSVAMARVLPTVEVEQQALDIDEVQSLDQKLIALDKAVKAYTLLQRPVLIDDAGIYMQRYHEFPGTMTKFVYEGLQFEGIKRLFDEGDRAYFRLYMVYMESPDVVKVFEGRCDGILIKPLVADAEPGLPWDVYFIPDGQPEGQRLTYSQMRHNPEYAHYFYRLRALDQCIAWFKENKKI
jgi:XTP/dITP diphosphohydrolase